MSYEVQLRSYMISAYYNALYGVGVFRLSIAFGCLQMPNDVVFPHRTAWPQSLLSDRQSGTHKTLVHHEMLCSGLGDALSRHWLYPIFRFGWLVVRSQV